MTENSQRNPSSAPRIPAWLAILVILLVMAAGGWMVWRYWLEGGPSRQVFGQGDPPVVRGNAEKLGDGVFRQQGNQWLVQAGDAQVRVNAPDGGEARFIFSYTTSLGISPADELYLNPRDKVNLTREQRRLLRNLDFVGPMKVDDADRAKIASLWQAQSKSPSESSQNALVEGLRQIAEKNRKATIEANQAIVAKAKAILTPEQLKQLETK